MSAPATSPAVRESGFTASDLNALLRRERKLRRRLEGVKDHPHLFKKKQRNEYLPAFAAKFAALHEANQQLPRRWRLNKDDLLREAETLDPWAQEDELVLLKSRPKATGGRRIIHSFRIRRRARSILLARATRPTMVFHPSQYNVLGQGGRHKAARDLAEHAKTHPWIVLADVRDCYGSVSHEDVRSVTKAPETVLEQTLSRRRMNLQSARKRDGSYCLSIGAMISMRLGYERAQISHGVPQGLAASALIVDAIIAQALARLPLGDARLVVYSDNIAIATRTRAEAIALTRSLRAAFSAARHAPVRPIEIRIIEGSRRADYGFEFLGYAMNKRYGRVEIRPSKRHMRRFRLLLHRWDIAKRVERRFGYAGFARPFRNTILSWLGAFREWCVADDFRQIILCRV